MSFDGKPAPIPADEIESDPAPRRDASCSYDPCPLLHEGDMVEVVHGPLKGVIGRLIRKGPKAKLILSVDLIRPRRAVDVDAADVQKPY